MSAERILIVEDEAVVALDLKLQLQDMGYVIAGHAVSGDEALALARAHAPDLVLMDVRLRGAMDGIDTARALQGPRAAPVIFLTSHSDDLTVQRAAQTAPYGYLTKPFQTRELRAGIEVALTKVRMERQLREADRWFAQTLQCVGDGVVLTDTHTHIRFLNPAAELLTGRALTEAQGQPLDAVLSWHAPVTAGDDEAASASARVRGALAQARPLPVKHGRRVRARDGSTRVVDETTGPVNDEDGRLLGAVVVLHDATARLAQESRLRASEERFRSAFDGAPLGMALVSMAGEYLQVNDAMCRLLDSSNEELRRLGHVALGTEAERAQEQQRLQSLLGRPGAVVQFERQFVPPGGGAAVPTLVSVSLLREAALDGSGNGLGSGDTAACYLYQVHDLRAQQAAAEQLAALAKERMLRQASEMANAAKSAFLSRVSHEMRTPLNAVLGFAQLLLLQQEPNREQVQGYARHIRGAGDHLLSLVTDLLDLNRAALGSLALQMQPVPLDSVVQEAVLLVQGLALAQGVPLHTQVDADLVVRADPTRLRQVLLNLLSNAIKYNRPGGSVRLQAEAAAPGRVRLIVRDEGIGMSDEQQQRLFQPFERLGLERSPIPGTGLGLVIARSLTLEMGGSLTLVSQVGSGTAVTLDLAAAG